MEYIPPEIRRNYQMISITPEEQNTLDTNMFTVDPKTVITRDSAHRINNELVNAGMRVIPISFDEPTKQGGNLRCSTLPLVRSRV